MILIILQTHSLDQWKWQLDHVGGYSVREIYHILTSPDSFTLDAIADLIWHIYKFLQRFLYLCEDYFMTDYQQKQTWCLATLSLEILTIVCSVVEVLNQLTTFFFHGAILVLFRR